MNAVDPCVIVIFGATGDLTRRRLLPALFQLFKRGTVNEKTPIALVAREAIDLKGYLAYATPEKFIKKAKPADLERFYQLLNFVRWDHREETTPDLTAQVNAIQEKWGSGPNRVIYLALPASVFSKTAQNLVKGNFFPEGGYRRVVFEKPFGHDLKSATELNEQVSAIFDEKQIYRIDHYVGKELVRNILILRFANPLFEQVWNNDFVDHVQITIGETLGVEGRGKYFEESGIIRDMLQNHILQILSLAAMEQPSSLDAEALRDEAVKVLRTLIPPRDRHIIIGQYDAGEIRGDSAEQDEKVPAYRNEPSVALDSRTETFIAMKILLDTPRWRDVPFYVRTGKRMAKKIAEVNIVLKDKGCAFAGDFVDDSKPNIISLRIQPLEGISVDFNVKEPGEEMKPVLATMEYCHHCLYAVNTPEAYEILLGQVLQGDQTLFTRWDFVEEAWSYVDPIIAMVNEQRDHFPNYPAGSWGPLAADHLIERDGREWFVSKDITM